MRRVVKLIVVGDKIKVFLVVVVVLVTVSSMASIAWRTGSAEGYVLAASTSQEHPGGLRALWQTILKFAGLWHPAESEPNRSFQYVNPDLLRKSQAESSFVLASPSPAVGASSSLPPLPPLPPLPKPGALGVKTVHNLPPVPRTGTVGETYVNFLEGIFNFLTAESSK